MIHATTAASALTALFLLVSLPPAVADPPFEPVAFPSAIVPISDQARGFTQWGLALDADGERVLVGAAAGLPGLWQGNGAAIWERDGEGWRRVAILTPTFPPLLGDGFGAAVAIDGDLAVVGAPGQKVGGSDRAGAVHVFEREEDGTWAPTQVLSAAQPVSFENFGASVALPGSRLVVGVPQRPIQGGADYFELNERGRFGYAISLDLPIGIAGQRWGTCVGLDEDLVVVGDPNAKVGDIFLAGAVATFLIKDDGVAFSDLITAPTVDPGGSFGARLALDGAHLAVASPGHDLNRGAVYLFRREGKTWTHLDSVDGESTLNRLGQVDLEGDRLVISSAGGLAAIPGWAAVYAIRSDALERVAEVRGASIDEQVGAATVLAGSWWFVHEEVDGILSGALLRGYHLGEVEGDCDGNGVPNGLEVTVKGANDCNGNLVPDACEEEEVDCNDNGLIGTCETQSVQIASVENDPFDALITGTTDLAVFLCRVDVPVDGAGALVAIRSSSATHPNYDSPVPNYVAVFRDADQDGVPANLTLLSAKTTRFPATVEPFRVPIDPIEVVPGESLYIALALPGYPLPENLYLSASTSGYVPGRTFVGFWPADEIDFVAIGRSLEFAEVSSYGTLFNIECLAEFASPIDPDGDGVPNECACVVTWTEAVSSTAPTSACCSPRGDRPNRISTATEQWDAPILACSWARGAGARRPHRGAVSRIR